VRVTGQMHEITPFDTAKRAPFAADARRIAVLKTGP
jgi:hypothetical protein